MKKNQVSESILQTISDSFSPDERFSLYIDGFDLIKFCVNGNINKNFDVYVEDLIHHVNNKFDHDMLYSFLNSGTNLTYKEYIENTWDIGIVILELVSGFICLAESYLEDELLFILTGIYLKNTVRNLFQIKSFLIEGNHYLYSQEFMSKLVEYNLTFDKFLEMRSKINNQAQ